MSDTGIMFIQEAAMFIALVALAGWVIWLLFRRYQIRNQETAGRLEVFSKLVDKFGDSKEFVTFVQSDDGKRLLKESGVNGSSAKQIALRMFVIGALLLAVGFGFLTGSSSYEHSTDINFVNKVAEMRYWGKMAFGLAVGFVGAGLLTRFLGSETKKDRDS